VGTTSKRPSLCRVASATETCVGFSSNRVWDFFRKGLSTMLGCCEDLSNTQTLINGVSGYMPALSIFIEIFLLKIGHFVTA